MSMDAMQAKVAIARELRKQSDEVFDYRVAHFYALTDGQRLSLAQQSSLLTSRAEEILADALEEGTQGAEELLGKLKDVTAELAAAKATLDSIEKVLSAATKVAKAAAGIISAGIPQGLSLL